MLSKMAQPNNVGGGSGSAAGGRRVPLSLSSGSGVAGGTTVSRLQQASGNGNGRSSSPQNSNSSKKGEHHSGPFIAMKKTNFNQQRSASASSSSSSSSVSKHDDEKKGQNGVNKSTNGNQKVSHSSGSSAAAVAKDQQKQPKEKEQKQEKKEAPKPEVKDEEKTSKKESETETKQTPASVETKKTKAIVTEVIDVDEEPKVVDVVPVVPTTPTSERKSSRRIAAATTPTSTTSTVNATPPAVTPQKTPTKIETVEPKCESPAQKQQQQPIATEPSVDVAAVEDVEMETLMVDASPIRSTVQQSAQPAATSTPGRNLFGFRSSSKQVNEVELAAQLSNSPASAPARTFAQISGRRSIRPATGLTPGKMGTYRCANTSELDTSGLTNTSMNATVGSEIPNSSSFSFSFFGRGRKRERTPPLLSGSQSANDLAQDVEMSPPKRARFEFFSMNLASPFSLLRSRFSKATISSPSARQRLDLTPPNGDDEEGSEVQNVSGVVNQEEEEEQQLNKSSASTEVTVGQEAGLETPKKVGTPEKDVPEEEKNEKAEAGKDKGDVSADLPTIDAAEVVEENSSTYGEGSNRSRCAIM